MAGIGFRLQKLLKGETLTDVLRAYIYSSVIATGPMLVIIFMLAGIRAVLKYQLNIEENDFFMALVIYVYAFSMLLVAPLVYVVTRYLADKYYLKQFTNFTPLYLSVLEVVFVIQTISFIPAISWLPLSRGELALLYMMYLFVGGVWVAMIILSAARNYLWIVWAFIGGAFMSVAFAYFIAPVLGFPGFLLGFMLGQGTIFFILTVRIFIEFGYLSTHDFAFFSYFTRHPYLVGVGLFYYLGIWIDRFIFWSQPEAQVVMNSLKIYSDYDTPMFVSFLSVVPSMAFFLIQMETTFVRYYHAYYESIRSRGTLSEINLKRSEMVKNLTENFQKFVLFQGTISAVVIFSLYRLTEGLAFNPLQVGILRISLLGAFIQMGFLMILNILFYFDYQKEAFLTCLTFFVCNGLFTYLSVQFGFRTYGFGFTLACLATLLMAYFLLDKGLRELNFRTFMLQPLSKPQFKYEDEVAASKN